MIVKEATAGTLLCCAARAYPKQLYCQGKRCMAWRRIRGDWDGGRGYCGLAGKPDIGPDGNTYPIVTYALPD